MKRRTAILLLPLCLLLAGSLRAQNYRNALTANPIGAFVGLGDANGNAQFEYALSGENSIVARFNFVSRDITSYPVNAYGIGGSYRWYLPPNRAIAGLWIAPAFDLLMVKWKYPDAETSSTFINICGEVGNKWIIEQWVIEPWFGLGISIGKVEAKLNRTLGYGNGVLWQLGLSLGYSW